MELPHVGSAARGGAAGWAPPDSKAAPVNTDTYTQPHDITWILLLVHIGVHYVDIRTREMDLYFSLCVIKKNVSKQTVFIFVVSRMLTYHFLVFISWSEQQQGTAGI